MHVNENCTKETKCWRHRHLGAPGWQRKLLDLFIGVSGVAVKLDCLFFQKGEQNTLMADLLLQWKFLNAARNIPTPDELVTGTVAPTISLSYPFISPHQQTTQVVRNSLRIMI